MHVTEIFIERQPLDLYTDKALKYKLQVNKIASPKDREASFLNSTSIPKTAKNVRLLRGLGLPSDTSPIPYTKPNCELKIDGFNFIAKGWIGFEEGSEDYKIKIYSGIVQFFKAIEGKKLGTDLTLTEINQPKNLANVVNSFTSPYYRYMIADYNGKTHYGANDDKINIDYLVPSVNVKYLWDLIHKTFGFTYSGLIFTSSQFNNLWITYPKPIEIGTETNILTTDGRHQVGNRNINWSNPEAFYDQITNNALVGGKAFVAPTSGSFRVKFSANTSKRIGVNGSYWMSVNGVDTPFSTRINPIQIADIGPDGYTEFATDRVVQLNAGDKLDFYTLAYFNGGAPDAWVTNYHIEILKIDDVAANFSEELKDFSITDFIKDILNMFGLTPFSNENNNNIDYRLITERFATAEVLDWSKKYIRRKSERYVYDTFAKQNYFRYQYNDKEGDYHDASLNIPNTNLSESKEIFKSKMYSPEKDITKFKIGSLGSANLRVFKMYDKTVKEKNGVTVIEYKSLDKRFHYCRSNVYPTNVTIGSEVYQQEQAVNSLPLIDFSGLSWSNLLQTFYYMMGRVMIDSKIHEIELNLNPTDVILLDMTKIIYFEQEQQYYVVDSIDYDGDETAVGRFIRVKRDPNAVIIPTDPTAPSDYVIEAIWTDGTKDPKDGYDTTVSMTMGAVSYPATDPIVAYTWEKFAGGVWQTMLTGPNPVTFNLESGENKFRIKGTTQNGFTYYGNELTYLRHTALCYVYTAYTVVPYGGVLVVEYINCTTGQLESRVEVNTSVFGQKQLSITVCAVEGTVSHNGTVLNKGNLC